MKKFIYITLLFLFIFCFVVSIIKLKQMEKSLFVDLGRINILILSKEKTRLFSFFQDEAEAFEFNNEDKILLTRGYGEYQIGKIFALGEMAGKGGQLIRESLQEHFKIPIMGYIKFDNNDISNDFFETFKNAYLNKYSTDLKRDDLLIVLLKSKMINKEKVNLSNDLKNLLPIVNDKGIKNEGVSIEFLNATLHNQLAGQASTIMENTGGRVIRTVDYSKQYENCQIIVSPSIKAPRTVSFLKIVYGCWQGTKPNSESRADISIIVGEDYWKKLNEKW